MNEYLSGGICVKYPITLTIGQWCDLEIEEICKTASNMGYDGLELSFKHGIIDLRKAANSMSYCEDVLALLKKYNLRCTAISAHAIGKCVSDLYDIRLNKFVPEEYKGKPEKIKKWAFESMMIVPLAAKNLGCDVVTGFMGSPIWKYFYSFPTTSQEMVDQGYKEVVDTWKIILDEFEKYGVCYALEVHPGEIAFDYYSAKRLVDELNHEALGINFDPSHLQWQGINPVLFLYKFQDLIKHVHMKDVTVRPTGLSGILGSHLPFGDYQRTWNFRSVGRGDVDFQAIIYALHDIDYHGPLSVEWEDNSMDRYHGAKESIEYIRSLDFPSAKFKWY